MNIKLRHIILSAFLLMNMATMAQAQSGVTVGGDIYGGGNLANVKGNSTVLINQTNAVVSGDVYGGGALAHVNVTATVSGETTTYSQTPGKYTQVDVIEGAVSGNIYGGGLGDDETAAFVFGEVTVNIGSGTVNADGFAESVSGQPHIGGSVFGCNNIKGTPKKDVFVNIFQTAHTAKDVVTCFDDDRQYAIDTVFGGGNHANYEPDANTFETTVHVYTCENTIQKVYGGGNAADVGNATIGSSTNIIIDGGRIEWVFGGGNGAGNHTDPTSPSYNPGANVFGDVDATFHAGDIQYFFGGSNEKGDIHGSKNIAILNDVENCITDHDNHIGELYGGNNKASITGGIGVSFAMPCTATPCKIDYVFGGSRMADIDGDVVLTISGGLYDYVFGGNNMSGTINGNVTLNLFGGTINNGAFGGNNVGGAINGKITVNMLEQGTCDLTVHNIYGGGYLASYAPTTPGAYPEINLIHGTVSKIATTSGSSATTYSGGNVYGGGYGNTATVTSNPVVKVGYDASMATLVAGLLPENTSLTTANVTVEGNVYGGGEEAPVAGNTSVTIQQAVSEGGFTANTTVGATAFGGDVYGGGNKANVSGSTTVNVTGGTVNQDVYGGGALADVNVTGSSLTSGAYTTVAVSGGAVRDVYGGGLGNREAGEEVEAKVYGPVTVTVDGGTIHDVFGCNNQNGAPQNSVEVYVNNNVSNNVYGGGNLASGTVSPVVYINNGVVGGSVFGGGKGDESDETGQTAMVTGNPQVTVGDANASHYAVVTGNVYGGGDAALVTGNTLVTYDDNHASSAVAKVFGGGNKAGVTGTADVDMVSGTVTAGLYGGCNDKGTVGGKVTVDVTGGTIGADALHADVHGGGYGQNTKTGNDVEVTINGAAVNIYGDVYGGSALGSVNSGNATPAVNPSCHTYVTLTNGTIHGDLYGGGLGQNSPTSIEAKVWSPVQVNINGGTVNNVFGCNNENGAPQSTVTVTVEQTGESMAVTNVFGGGNLAQYNGAPTVNINNGTVGGNVYGGGKGVLASGSDRGVKGKVTGNPQVNVGDDVAGHVAKVTGDVYGGGDAADVAGTPVVVVNDCNTEIGYLYGGGNAADVNGTNVTVNAVKEITQAFGGGHGDKTVTTAPLKYADVKGNVVFNVYGGTIGQTFAGSNSKGSITGTSTLTVNKTGSCAMKLNEVYGGGNEADGHAGTIIIGCTGPLVALGENEHYGVDQEGIRYVYGGANAADINNDIHLLIHSGNIENVFGGNNISGSISGTITVDIDSTGTCGWYVGNVFGGGNQAAYTKSGTNYPAVNILAGTVSGDVFGGGLGSTGDMGKVTANPQVTVNGTKARVNGSVYGGGSLAPTQGNPTVTLTNGSLNKVFGGGKAADIIGAPVVTITNGRVSTGVYGGCDNRGNVSGNIVVNVNGGQIGTLANLQLATPVIANVFGGGYGGVDGDNPGTSTSGNVEVNVNGGTIYGDVYGGSAFGTVNANGNNTTTVNVMDGTLETNMVLDEHNFAAYNGGNVYGGGLGEEGAANASKGQVNGQVFVNVGSGTMSTENPKFTSDTQGNATIKGNIYGCNNTNGSPQQNVVVNIYQTKHTEGVDDIDSDGYALHNVFGGGNKADFTVTGKTPTVNIYGCENTIERTFGGSNAAASNSVTTMIQGGHIREAYGGGNGEVSPADIHGDVILEIHGGRADLSFGGSNQHGTISGASTVTIDGEGCGETLIDEFFCGGNFADYYGDINATIRCAAGLHVKNLYGGCKQADVLPTGTQIGSVHLVVEGGTYENIFGGSQGRLAGQSTQYPTEESADISGDILLEIHGGTVTNAIYGGSHIRGKVAGTIVVNIENKNTGCELDLSAADVYGGGNEADYDTEKTTQYNHDHPDYPQINIKNATVKNVFGGGYMAEVKGNPQIRLKKGAMVLGNVYGGGNMGEMKGDPRVIINGEDNSENPHVFPTY